MLDRILFALAIATGSLALMMGALALYLIVVGFPA